MPDALADAPAVSICHTRQEIQQQPAMWRELAQDLQRVQPQLTAWLGAWLSDARHQVLFSSLDHCNWVTEEFARLIGLPLAVMERGRQLMVRRSAGRMDWERLCVGDLLAHTDEPTLLLHDVLDPEVPIEHLFSIMARCADRPLQVHVTDGLGHHRLLGDAAVMRRVQTFMGNAA